VTRIDIKPGLSGLPFGIAGVALLFTIASVATRAVAMLGPGNLRALFMLMLIAMMTLPWLVLSSPGRRQIGIKRPSGPFFWLAGLAVGVIGAATCFAIGVLLFGSSPDNWFVSVANNYRLQPTAGWSLLRLHLTFTIAACLFSPLGEEIFFRGFLQKVLEQRFSVRTSTHLEAGLFALSHLCHHGIVVTAAGLVLLPLSGALWIMLMFTLSLAFAWLRKSSDSVFPAVLSHAAFNATMNGFIFAYLWP
jgi:membrane protease YdiL (CAAX protease family)